VQEVNYCDEMMLFCFKNIYQEYEYTSNRKCKDIPEWQKVGKQSRDDSFVSIQHHMLFSGKREKICWGCYTEFFMLSSLPCFANLKKKEQHFGCLVTFRFSTFVIIYSTFMSLVCNENTWRLMLCCYKHIHSGSFCWVTNIGIQLALHSWHSAGCQLQHCTSIPNSCALTRNSISSLWLNRKQLVTWILMPFRNNCTSSGHKFHLLLLLQLHCLLLMQPITLNPMWLATLINSLCNLMLFLTSKSSSLMTIIENG